MNLTKSAHIVLAAAAFAAVTLGLTLNAQAQTAMRQTRIRQESTLQGGRMVALESRTGDSALSIRKCSEARTWPMRPGIWPRSRVIGAKDLRRAEYARHHQQR